MLQLQHCGGSIKSKFMFYIWQFLSSSCQKNKSEKRKIAACIHTIPGVIEFDYLKEIQLLLRNGQNVWDSTNSLASLWVLPHLWLLLRGNCSNHCLTRVQKPGSHPSGSHPSELSKAPGKAKQIHRSVGWEWGVCRNGWWLYHLWSQQQQHQRV